MSPAEVSVLICTVGRPEMVRRALVSLERCDPVPAEVVVVDQSSDLSSRELTAAAKLPLARTVRSEGRGKGLALNEGLRAAAYEFVLITDDDCTAAPEWVGAAERAMVERPDGMLTGQVLPAGDDARHVPSTIRLDEPRDYTGEIHPGYLFGGNMACPRSAVLQMGGFDERIVPAPGVAAAEDCDLCYRWLRAGRTLRHIPGMVVTHHDWRSEEDLSRHYIDYSRAQGMFYAKHLRQGDLRMLRFIAYDYYAAARSVYSGIVRGVPRWADYRRGVFAGMPGGLLAGWRLFKPAKDDEGRGSGPAITT